MMLTRPKPHHSSIWLDPLRKRLAEGKYTQAADAAVSLARKHADDSSFMCELVEVLAGALIAVGDRHATRGRPARMNSPARQTDDVGNFCYQLDELPSTPEALGNRFQDLLMAHRIERAAMDLYLLVQAEAHLRGKPVSSHDLAGILWQLNEEVLDGTDEGDANKSTKSMAAIIEHGGDDVRTVINDCCRSALKKWGLSNKMPKKFYANAFSAVCARSGLPDRALQKAYRLLARDGDA